ncbi:hypothetical protein ACN6LA_000588 [Streptomyces sp. SAS_269]|uniref:hypothetical protein n=1 Tax=Streptomyces sp. SAS_269 TaxID=3412749 RepID=UPI00403D0C2E
MHSNVRESYSWDESSNASLSSLTRGNFSDKSVDELKGIAARANPATTHWQEWETLRELSDGRMRDDRQDTETRLDWARLALTACQRKRESGEVDRVKILADEAHIRVYAIRTFGPTKSDPMLDMFDLCAAVFREIGKTREEVAAETADWKSLPPNRMLRLRYVKNLLTPLQALMDTMPEDPMRQRLAAWLSLIPHLP